MGEKDKIMIVGGGISGLTAASLLAKKGYDVVLIEKNETCGGLVNSFDIDGFTFDGGIRAVENAGMILPMLEELEIDLPMLPSRVSLGIEDNIMHAISEDSINDYEALLKQTYPESPEDVEKVTKVIKDFNEYMKVLFGDESPFYKDKKRHKRYYFTTFFSWFLKFIKTGIAVTQMKLPVEDFLHDLIDNEPLFDIISQHFFKKTPAFFAMSYFSLYTDYYYPKGGVGQLPRQIGQKFREAGGTLLLNTDISQIDIKGRRVIDTLGTSYPFRKLIWCADMKSFYRSVNIEDTPSKYRNAVEKDRSRILSAKGAESVFTIFLGVDEAPEFFQKISHGHFFYTPSRKGLGRVHREDYASLMRQWNSENKADVLSWLKRLCELNTFEISIPVLNDQDTAPEGKTGLIISFLMDYELPLKIQEDGWYEQFKIYIEETVIDLLDRTIYPGFKNNITYRQSSSPLTVEQLVGSSEGAIVGWSFESEIPIDASMLNMKKSVLTPFPDIYRAGQWTASPAGLPTCIMTAKMAADRVMKDLQ